MFIEPLEIKVQDPTDFCMGCVISSIAEEYVHEPCDESYSFAAGKFASGEDLLIRGINPRAGIQGAIDYGVLPKSKSPYSIASHERGFLADFKNWQELRKFAIFPFKSSRRIRGFDRIIEVLERERTSVMIGIYWQAGWNKTPYLDSIENFNRLEPHEVRAIGVQDGRIIIQNSRGVDKGNAGLWHLGRGAAKAIGHAYVLSSKPKKSFLLNLIDNL